MEIPVREWLSPNLTTVLTTLVVLVIIYVLFKKFLFAPARLFLQKRQAYIQKQITEANQSRADAAAQLAKANAHLATSWQTGKEIIATQKSQAHQQGVQIIQKACLQAQLIKEQTLFQLEREKEQAYHHLNREITTISTLMASKILEKEISPDLDQRAIKKFMEQVDGKQ